MANKKELLKKFNAGTLSSEESDLLEEMFVSDKLTLDDFDIYKNFETIINSEKISQSIDNKFESMLANEIQNNKPKKSNSHWFEILPLPLKLAFPIMILLCGFLLGKSWQASDAVMPTQYANNNSINQNNSQMVNDLLYHPSSSERLTLVNNANNLNNDKNQTIRLLFMSLNFDKSSSVRMAAVDALMNYANEAIVREGLIKSLGQQKSLLMIQYINEALKITGENVSNDKLRHLVQDNIPNDDILTLEQNLY